MWKPNMLLIAPTSCGSSSPTANLRLALLTRPLSPRTSPRRHCTVPMRARRRGYMGALTERRDEPRLFAVTPAKAGVHAGYVSGVELFEKIAPGRVVLLNQAHFPRALPGLDHLFTRNRVGDLAMLFGKD